MTIMNELVEAPNGEEGCFGFVAIATAITLGALGLMAWVVFGG